MRLSLWGTSAITASANMVMRFTDEKAADESRLLPFRHRGRLSIRRRSTAWRASISLARSDAIGIRSPAEVGVLGVRTGECVTDALNMRRLTQAARCRYPSAQLNTSRVRRL